MCFFRRCELLSCKKQDNDPLAVFFRDTLSKIEKLSFISFCIVFSYK